jgi:hypothetical protein
MENVRRIIRHLLEAAVGGQQAVANELALYRKGMGEAVVYVLYDPTTLEEQIPLYQDGAGDISSVIYGYLKVWPHSGESWNAGEVGEAAAKKGYGPLMYELAMSDFENGLMPDRTSTSAAARNIWKVFNQRTDVGKKPLDDKKNPKTPPKVDDAQLIPDFDGEEAYLNQVYVGRGDPSKNALMQNHQKAITDVAMNTKQSEKDIAQIILSMGDEYFGTRYRDG